MKFVTKILMLSVTVSMVTTRVSAAEVYSCSSLFSNSPMIRIAKGMANRGIPLISADPSYNNACVFVCSMNASIMMSEIATKRQFDFKMASNFSASLKPMVETAIGRKLSSGMTLVEAEGVLRFLLTNHQGRSRVSFVNNETFDPTEFFLAPSEIFLLGTKVVRGDIINNNPEYYGMNHMILVYEIGNGEAFGFDPNSNHIIRYKIATNSKGSKFLLSQNQRDSITANLEIVSSLLVSFDPSARETQPLQNKNDLAGELETSIKLLQKLREYTHNPAGLLALGPDAMREEASILYSAYLNAEQTFAINPAQLDGKFPMEKLIELRLGVLSLKADLPRSLLFQSMKTLGIVDAVDTLHKEFRVAGEPLNLAASPMEISGYPVPKSFLPRVSAKFREAAKAEMQLLASTPEAAKKSDFDYLMHISRCVRGYSELAMIALKDTKELTPKETHLMMTTHFMALKKLMDDPRVKMAAAEDDMIGPNLKSDWDMILKARDQHLD